MIVLYALIAVCIVADIVASIRAGMIGIGIPTIILLVLLAVISLFRFGF